MRLRISDHGCESTFLASRQYSRRNLVLSAVLVFDCHVTLAHLVLGHICAARSLTGANLESVVSIGLCKA
jgi:hypothetical protein